MNVPLYKYTGEGLVLDSEGIEQCICGCVYFEHLYVTTVRKAPFIAGQDREHGQGLKSKIVYRCIECGKTLDGDPK